MKKYKNYLIAVFVLLVGLISICFIPISVSKLIPTIEAQAYKDYGVKIHVDKLILRVGPFVKLKAPIMHIMYEDGKKFAQLDNVKLHINLLSIIKKSPQISRLYANKLNIRIDENDKEFFNLLNKLQSKNFNSNPDIILKSYELSYNNKENTDNYCVKGQNLDVVKLSKYENLKIATIGSFFINDTNYINYDLTINPKFNSSKIDLNYNIVDILNQIKELDFHSDIIANLTIYKNSEHNLMYSGYINIDNISVLDKSKKNFKSFIYLTLMGDKIGVDSNIYTSVNKKIQIVGKANNNKKLYLDLKVKTDEVELADLFQKTKLFIKLSKFKNISSVDGKINANFNIKGELDNLKSSGFLKIIDTTVKTNDFKIEKINSDIDFSNNKININNAIGYVNNTAITANGHVDKNIDIEFAMNKVNLKHLLPEKYGVKDGVISLISKITGTCTNISHKEILDVENLNIQNEDYKVSVQSIKLNTNKNQTAYINNIQGDSKYTDQFKIPSLKINFDNDNIKIPDTNLFLPNSKIVFRGDVLNYLKQNMSFSACLDGFINSKDINFLHKTSNRYPVKLLVNGSKNYQNIDFQTVLEKAEIFDEPIIINLNAKQEKNSLKIDDLSVSSFSGDFSNDFKSNIKGSKKIVLNGVVDDIKKSQLKNIRVFIPQLLNITYLDTFAQLKGDLFLNGNIKSPDIIGQIFVQNMHNKPTQISINNGVLDFNKNVILLNAPSVKFADSSLGVNGSISTDFSDNLKVKNLNIKSKYLNTDTLLMYKDNLLLNSYPIEILSGKFYSERILANVYNEQLYLTAFNSNFNMKNNLVNLTDIQAELFNGKLAGSVSYELKTEFFDTDLMVRGVSAEPIFNVVSNRKDDISGVMDFDAKLKGELTSKQSLNGYITFLVNNGRMSTLGKLEHLLYAQNVIADNMLRTSLSVVTKAITLKDTGLFKFLRGHVVLEEGIANINMLQSQGPLMSLFIKGQYNPINDYANLVVLGRLSDEVISGLGAFGDFSINKLMIMLTGEDLKQSVLFEDFEKIPPLPMKNTKEFRSIIKGIVDKPSSVQSFNWISYTEKSLKQKEVPLNNIEVPDFIKKLPY